MPERFGLFTLIVLGEAIVAVSAGTAHDRWTTGSLAAAAAAFVLAACLWWLYFARFDGEVFNWALDGSGAARLRSYVYGYAHLVLFPATAAIGVGAELAITAANGGAGAPSDAPVMCAGVAAYLLSLSAIQAAAPADLGRGALLTRAAVAIGAGARGPRLAPGRGDRCGPARRRADRRHRARGAHRGERRRRARRWESSKKSFARQLSDARGCDCSPAHTLPDRGFAHRVSAPVRGDHGHAARHPLPQGGSACLEMTFKLVDSPAA
jgi:hypothetical protein